MLVSSEGIEYFIEPDLPRWQGINLRPGVARFAVFCVKIKLAVYD